MLDKCLYVEDFVGALDNVSSAFQWPCEAKRIMADVGMNLCKWISNSKELLQTWEDKGFKIHPIHSKANPTEKLQKVLGLPWHVHQDYITIHVKDLLEFNKGESVTKRTVLKTTGKLYDGLGLLTPMSLKCQFQELWLRKCSWDAELPADLLQKYTQWKLELSDITNLQVPRMILDGSLGDANELQICVFSDASQGAYGTAVYLRVKNVDKISVNLIASKSRVAPLKKLYQNLNSWGIARSQTCEKLEQIIILLWTKGPHHKWKQFVSKRVKEIQALSNPEVWLHIPGKLNIANLVTRGVSVEGLLKNETWCSGPVFLRTNEVSVFQGNNSIPEEYYISEMKKRFSCVEGDIPVCFAATN
ncbi:uncharacterized protein LOC118187320 [Stegodyphus dumicola]|uniref:uncharacterized protein LOC118187320 n=1 Tax=Stegodyphus dumicola TaxID=202533 RepID=UPI0015B230FA|nr:uncharacterized protein LOC118187320 [Stegodyphus dumicola]